MLNNLKILITLVIAVGSIMLAACSEDPVKVNNNSESIFDSARFNWSTYILYETGLAGGSGGCLWAEDTNNVFLIKNNGIEKCMIKISNGIVTKYYFDDFYPRYIAGTNNSNIYIVGNKLTNGIYKHLIKRWNGAGFEDIEPIVPNYEDVRLMGIAIKNPNEIWYAGWYMMLKYDGYQFSYYPRDTNFALAGFYFKNNIKPRYIAGKILNGELKEDIIYEFYGTGWSEIFRRSINQIDSNTILFRNFRELEFGFTRKEIYTFNENGFNEYIVIPGNKKIVYFLDGLNLSDFCILMINEPFQQFDQFISNWNGVKWSIEIPMDGFSVAYYRSFYANQNLYYFIIEDEFTGYTYIFRGVRKLK